MWDWRTGYNFQRIHAAVQPGSLDSESGIFACMFDNSESRLITAEADKTIKVYKEDDTAVSNAAMFETSSELSFPFQAKESDHPVFFSSSRRKKAIPSTGNQKSSREKDSNDFFFIIICSSAHSNNFISTKCSRHSRRIRQAPEMNCSFYSKIHLQSSLYNVTPTKRPFWTARKLPECLFLMMTAL